MFFDRKRLRGRRGEKIKTIKGCFNGKEQKYTISYMIIFLKI